MEKLTDVLAMGGYGAYVWPSFIVAAIIMGAMVAFSLRSLRRVRKSLARLQEYNEG